MFCSHQTRELLSDLSDLPMATHVPKIYTERSCEPASSGMSDLMSVAIVAA